MLRAARAISFTYAASLACASPGNWTQLNGAAFANRSDFALTTWRGAVWLAGGGNYSVQYSLYGDVLRSKDGAVWETVEPAAPWTARAYHAAAASSDDTTLILAGGGGCVATSFNSSLCPEYRWFNDVWTATATDQPSGNTSLAWRQFLAPWTQRGGLSLNVLPGAGAGGADLVVVAAGLNSTAVFADVWGSSDGGASWKLLVAAAPFGERAFHSTAVLPAGADATTTGAATLVLVGGAVGSTYLNDAWATEDGTGWRLLNSAAPFSGRYGAGLSYVPAAAAGAGGTHSSASAMAVNGTLWLTGGAAAYPVTQMSDVWVSSDGGASWTRAADGAWAPRSFHLTAVLPASAYNSHLRLVVVAGWNVILPFTYHYLGDTWGLDFAA